MFIINSNFSTFFCLMRTKRISKFKRFILFIYSVLKTPDRKQGIKIASDGLDRRISLSKRKSHYTASRDRSRQLLASMQPVFM